MRPKLNLVKNYISLALAFSASQTFAQDQFDGLNMSIGAGIYNADSNYYNSGATDISNNPITTPWTKNDSSVLGDLSLGYSHGLKNNFNIAGNIFYSFGSVDQNYHNGLALDPSANALVDTKFKLKDIWGISFEPGYYFTQNILGYLKLGYAYTSVKANASGYLESVNYDFGNPGGFLYGAGLKYKVTNDIFLGADLYRVDFGAVNILNSPHFQNPDPENLRMNLDVNYLGLKIGYTFNQLL
jgi:opacity protein-like surface antigen